MPELHIILTPEELNKIPLVDTTIVVIDTLRASTSIITALANGAQSVIPFAEKGKLESYYQKYRDKKNLIPCGEKKGRPIEGFTLGNSPIEYKEKIVKDKKILLKTTNGTKVLTALNTTNLIYIGALVNSLAVVKKIEEIGKDLYLVCAGTRGSFSLEDFFTAGRYSSLLLKRGWSGGDLVAAASRIYQDNKDYKQIYDIFLKSQNGQNLKQLGYLDDIKFASMVDIFDVVPVWNGKEILL